MRYLFRLFQLMKTMFIYKLVFRSIGNRSYVSRPLKIQGGKNISIGNGVYVAEGTWLAALPVPGSTSASLQIGDGTNLGHFNHIYATGKIVIGKHVLTADKVYISDNLHEYENIDLPIMQQPVKQLKDVQIGDGSWLGEHVCVIGASIGRQCVIGANAVVTRDIPDYCVAVGTPAYIIKRFCTDSRSWKKTDKEGNFV